MEFSPLFKRMLPDGHFRIRSRHVIACGGARGKVRANLNIDSDGEDSGTFLSCSLPGCLGQLTNCVPNLTDETMMTIHFTANLRPVVGQRVGMLHWIMDPTAAGFIIGYDLSGNQVHISNIDVGWTIQTSL